LQPLAASLDWEGRFAERLLQEKLLERKRSTSAGNFKIIPGDSPGVTLAGPAQHHPNPRIHVTRLILIGFIASAVLGAFTGCGPNARDPQPFGIPTAYKVGKKPATLVAHDMNNDEFPDLLVLNTDDHTLMFFEGNGDGSFKKPFVMKTGREPVALAVADFNGDRIPDTAVCNYGDGNFSVILGQKDGVFKILDPVKTGKLPIAITTGDFNNDRKADLAVTLRFDKLIIFLGNGDGTFKHAEAYIAPGTPARLISGDYNGDNNQDLAITFNSIKMNFIRVYNGNGDGTFQVPKKFFGGKQASYITQSDMNGDGHLDLIISSPTADSLTLFLGDGKGDFKRQEDFAAEKGPGYIVSGEFTGDRIPDLIVGNVRDGDISLLQGRGDGSFIFPHFNYPVGRQPRAVAGADFNKDGLKDLAVLLYDSATLQIFMRKIDIGRIES